MKRIRKFNEAAQANFKQLTEQALSGLTDEGFGIEISDRGMVTVCLPDERDGKLSIRSKTFGLAEISADLATYMEYIQQELGHEPQMVLTLSKKNEGDELTRCERAAMTPAEFLSAADAGDNRSIVAATIKLK